MQTTTIDTRRAGWPRQTIGMLAALLVGLVSLLVVPTAAQAADATVSGVAISVVNDGTPSWDALDSGPNNGVVRTQDQVQYKISTSYGALGDATFTSTLPAGARWDVSAAASTIWNGPGGGSISADGRTLTGTRTSENAAEDFNLIAWVYGLGNGASLAPSVTFGGVNQTAPAVTIAAEVKTEIRTYRDNTDNNYTYAGSTGVRWIENTFFGAMPNANGDMRGFEALENPFTYQLEVPPGASAIGYSLGMGGTVTLTQPGGPGTTVTVTVTGADSSFRTTTLNTAATGAGFRAFGRANVILFTPHTPNVPSGAITTMTTQVRAFDPNGVGGGSNFGAGYAPGQAPSDVCPSPAPTVNPFLTCQSFTVDRTATVPIIVSTNAAARVSDTAYFLSDNHYYVVGNEKVVPGQSFMAYQGFYNQSTSPSDVTSANGCQVFDNQLLALRGVASLGIGNVSFARAGLGGTELTGSDRVIEYSASVHADNAARKAFDCGVAEDGATGWYGNLASVPGGAAAVTAVRFKANVPLAPSQGVSLKLPLQRTTTATSLALATNAPLPWFWSYGTDQNPRVSSTYSGTGASMAGGYVQAVDALVRHRSAWSNASAAPGDLRTLTVKPVVIGPAVAGIDKVAKNVQVTVTMSHTTAVPVKASLDALVTAGMIEGYTQTGPDAGADGILGTADDGAPASIVFDLGDVDAPGGAVGTPLFHAGVGGHETWLTPFNIQVENSALTPSGRNHIATSVISSDSDTSLAFLDATIPHDRTETATVSVNGVAGFQTGKAANTATDGYVAPGEEFSYTINWGNATAEKVGEGTFVDVLPFDGDSRGTTGLGTGGLAVVSVVAQMQNPTVMGGVTIQYTATAAATVQSALATAGNEDGHTGITWTAWPTSGPAPTGVTALRFITTDQLDVGYTGSATMNLKAVDVLGQGGLLKNNVFGRTAAVNGDANTIKVIQAAATNTIESSAATVSGTAYRDLDFDSAIGAADDEWPATGLTVQFVPVGGGTTYSTALNADGTYSLMVAGGVDYTVSLSGTPTAGWAQKLPATAVTVAVDDTLTGQDLLYQEVVAASTLVDDTAQVSAGAEVTVNVVGNDTLVFPATTGSVIADGITVSTAPTHGTAALVAPVSPATQSSIKYTAASAWPAAFDGQTKYTDTFQYTFTNASGATETAEVEVTVIKPVDGESTVTGPAIPVAGTSTLDAEIVGEGVTAGTPSGVPTGATATVTDDGVLTFNAGTAAPGVHTVTVVFTDAEGNTKTVTYTVTVQAPPTATGGTATIAEDGTHTFAAAPAADPAVSGASIASASVTTAPSAGTATATAAGVVTFTAGAAAPGASTFDVTFTDNLGQTVVKTYTVTVQAKPTATGGTAIIAEGGSHEFAADPTADPAVASATIASAAVTTAPTSGTVTYDLATGKVKYEADAAAAPGDYTFKVTFTDNLDQTVEKEYTVTVQAKPVVTGTTSDLIGENDTADFTMTIATTGTISTAVVTDPPADGIVTVGTDGTVSFDPDGAGEGVYTFEVTFTDNLGQTSVVAFTVTVQAAPTVTGVTDALIGEAGPADFNLTVDTTGTITKAEVTNPPAAGKVTVDTNGQVSFDPDGAAPGVYTFEVTFTDNVGQTVTETLTVTIQAMIKVEDQQITIEVNGSHTFTEKVTVGAGGSYTREIITQPAQGTATLGSVIYQAGSAQPGTYKVVVRYTDNVGQIADGTYTIIVSESMANTGSGIDPMMLGGVAALLLLGGGGLLLAVRRRRKQVEAAIDEGGDA